MNNDINNRLPIKEMLKRLNNPYEVHKFEIEDKDEIFICSVCGFGFSRYEINIFHGNLHNIKLFRKAVDCIPNKK
tara:strand:+ start:3145 stop:3369 length:225 start_codon:yes stop_codon:yes gene_type:complete